MNFSPNYFDIKKFDENFKLAIHRFWKSTEKSNSNFAVKIVNKAHKMKNENP